MGTIPSSIWNATLLEILDLGGNLLTGSISTELGKLRQLQSLNFKGTAKGNGNDGTIINLKLIIKYHRR